MNPSLRLRLPHHDLTYWFSLPTYSTSFSLLVLFMLNSVTFHSVCMQVHAYYLRVLILTSVGWGGCLIERILRIISITSRYQKHIMPALHQITDYLVCFQSCLFDCTFRQSCGSVNHDGFRVFSKSCADIATKGAAVSCRGLEEIVWFIIR